MATLNPNTLIGIIQGKLGDLVFVRRKDGKIFVRRRPKRRAPTTEAEQVVHSRLVESNFYVQRSKQQADRYGVYEAASRASGKRACDLAKADGVLLEHGAAGREAESSDWIYTTQAALPASQAIVVHVSASDRPGNVATKTVHHAFV